MNDLNVDEGYNIYIASKYIPTKYLLILGGGGKKSNVTTQKPG
jgi:hypothetical protein